MKQGTSETQGLASRVEGGGTEGSGLGLKLGLFFGGVGFRVEGSRFRVEEPQALHRSEGLVRDRWRKTARPNGLCAEARKRALKKRLTVTLQVPTI